MPYHAAWCPTGRPHALPCRMVPCHAACVPHSALLPTPMPYCQRPCPTVPPPCPTANARALLCRTVPYCAAPIPYHARLCPTAHARAFSRSPVCLFHWARAFCMAFSTNSPDLKPNLISISNHQGDWQDSYLLLHQMPSCIATRMAFGFGHSCSMRCSKLAAAAAANSIVSSACPSPFMHSAHSPARQLHNQASIHICPNSMQT